MMSLLIASIIGFGILSWVHRPVKWQEPDELYYYGNEDHIQAFREAFQKKNIQFKHFQ